MATTPKHAFVIPVGTDAADGPDGFSDLALSIESLIVVYGQGTLASRPAAAKQGRVYFATDAGFLYYDTGSAWITIGPATIGDGTVTTPKLADDAVTEPKIADNAVTALQIAAGAVGASEIADGAVGSAEINDALKPSAGASGGTEALRALGSGSGNAAAGNDSRLSDQRVPTDGSVTPVKLAAEAVETAKIDDFAVTENKLASDAVTAAKIATGAVGATELASGAVSSDAKVATSADISHQKIKTPVAKVIRDTNINIAPTTDFMIPWETEIEDNEGFWAIGSSSRLTIPVSGVYEISGKVVWGLVSVSGITVWLELVKNGSTTFFKDQRNLQTDIQDRQMFSTMERLVAGDYVELQGSHGRPSNLAVVGEGASTFGGSFITIKYLTR